MLNLFMMQKNEKKKKKIPSWPIQKLSRRHGKVCTYFAHFVGMPQEKNRAFPCPWGIG